MLLGKETLSMSTTTTDSMQAAYRARAGAIQTYFGTATTVTLGETRLRSAVPHGRSVMAPVAIPSPPTSGACVDDSVTKHTAVMIPPTTSAAPTVSPATSAV